MSSSYLMCSTAITTTTMVLLITTWKWRWNSVQFCITLKHCQYWQIVVCTVCNLQFWVNWNYYAHAPPYSGISSCYSFLLTMQCKNIAILNGASIPKFFDSLLWMITSIIKYYSGFHSSNRRWHNSLLGEKMDFDKHNKYGLEAEKNLTIYGFIPKSIVIDRAIGNRISKFSFLIAFIYTKIS